MKTIHRTHRDTEVISVSVRIECPYCGNEQLEEDADNCGTTYQIRCEECDEEFLMHFDAS